MHIVIGGGGRIGRFIAEDMVTKGHDVTVIEREPQRCEDLVANHPVLVIHGDISDLRYLEQARLERADVFVATTHFDDTNLVACQLAKIEFNIERAIARVNAPANVEIFTELGIEGISSTSRISQLLENEFNVNELVHLTTLKGGRANVVEVRIPQNAKGEIGRSRLVIDLPIPTESILIAIFRGERTIIPRGTTTVEPGDEIVALTAPEAEEDLRVALLGRRK